MEETQPCRFKPWDNVGFCKRHRYLAKRLASETLEGLRFDLHYEVDAASIDAGESGVTFLVKSVHEAEWRLRARLAVYEDEIVRFTVTEVDPLHPRYQVPDHDLLSRGSTTFTSVSYAEGSIGLVYRRLHVSLQLSPMRIDVYFEGSLTATLNHRSLFSFERYRTQETQPETSEASEVLKIVDASEVVYQTEAGFVRPDDLWQESFNEFTDTKPRGPSSVALDVKFSGASQLYGIPEHTDSINLADTLEGEPYRLFNLDVYAYKVDSRHALYGAIPFLIAKQGSHACGLFWNNPSNTYVDIVTADSAKQVHWMSEAGVVDVFVLPSDSIISLVSKFSLLTGPAALPPLAALGFHQCRWNYDDQADVLGVVEGFDLHNLPLDFIWLDIEHTVGRRYFTWDLQKFPDPTAMQKSLASKSRRLVTIIDPHIKRDPDYHIFAETSGKHDSRLHFTSNLPLREL
jgi:alpha 1,3-glucosidase